jgi:FKBP-type peptidyl-prolyl cis-trans isomerase
MSDKASLSEDEVRDVYNEVVLKLSTPDHWKKMNELFLSENAKKDGVKTTESGLQYKVLVEGNGDIPKANDAVNVFYSGRFINGVEFDSTARRNSPVNLPVTGGMPKGWTEALQMMKCGSKWRLFIPASLGYGSMKKASIWPDSTLIFDVELVDIGAFNGNGQNTQRARQADVPQASQALSK